MSSQPGTSKLIACTVCRQRKVACDRGRPRCGLCEKNDFDCQYIFNDRRPGLRAGFVSHLEKRIGIQLPGDPEQHVSDNGDVASLERRFDEFALEHGREVLHAPATASSHEVVVQPYDGNSSEVRDDHQSHAGDVQMQSQGQDVQLASEPSIGQLTPTALLDADGSLILLSPAMVLEHCTIWFEKYHPLFPILHQPSFLELVEKIVDPGSSDRPLVLQAIIAITAVHSENIKLTPEQRRRWSAELHQSTLTAAMSRPTFDAVQGLLILWILSYGEGNMSQSWSVLAICRRISVHIALQETASVLHDANATGSDNQAEIRSSSNQNIHHEECRRAYWMIEMLESISTLGAKYCMGSSTFPRNTILPSSDSMWAHTKNAINQSMSQGNISSTFSLCIMLAVTELPQVHRFLAKHVDMERFEERDQWQSEGQRIDEKLTIWREDFVAMVFRLINAEFSDNPRSEMEPYIVLTNCVLNSAVITLLQRRAPCPRGIEQREEPWAFAHNRCVYACENMAYKISQMHHEEIMVCHPHLVFSIFIAARFYIVYSKALDADVPTNLHTLAFTLHTSKARWPLAHIYETVIRTAVAEYRTPIALCSLPKVFYDLRFSTFEITPSLKTWAETVPAGFTPEYTSRPAHSS